MQAAVAVAERRVAAVVRRLYVVVTVLGLLVQAVLQVEVSVKLVAEAAVLLLVVVLLVLVRLLVLVVVGPSVEARLGAEGGGGDYR